MVSATTQEWNCTVCWRGVNTSCCPTGVHCHRHLLPQRRSRSSGSSRGGRRQCLSWRQLYEINSADRRASTPIVTALDVNKPDVRHFCYSSSLQSVFFQPPDMSWCRSAVQIFWQLFIDSCRAQLYLFSSLQCNLASTKICVILYCDLILQICCHLWTTYNAF